MSGTAQPALDELAAILGLTAIGSHHGRETFTGPVPGNGADPELLARACWALALLTEVNRAGPAIAGPLAPFTGRHAVPRQPPSYWGWPPAALRQLAEFRRVFEAVLLPALARRHGTRALGPTFTGLPGRSPCASRGRG